jgi:MurNAc alpha-1-phosphate uridylyltransferase
MKGMVLAAGLGTRMRPLTADTAKPLLTLAGRTLLDHALDRFAEGSIEEAVVNAHWKAERVVEATRGRERPRLRVQLEPELLETGGGVRRALPLLGPGPFCVANGDAFWLDGATPTLERMRDRFDAEAMDGLLLMVRMTAVENPPGRGDFMMDPLGVLRRPLRHEVAPFLYGGLQILHPRLLEPEPVEPFSLNRCYDRAIAAGRLFGLVHDGVWFHLSTPADLQRAETRLADGRFYGDKG